MSEFEARYEIDDGYVGKSRPKYFAISEHDLEDDMCDEELRRLFYELMRENFEQNIKPGEVNLDEFVTWAQERIKEMDDE